jgi:hypothetical protein
MPDVLVPYDRPFPFIFLSRNFAYYKNNAEIVEWDVGQRPTVWWEYPEENIIDGNRESYCRIQGLGYFVSADAYAYLKLDLSESIMPGEQVDVITFECDPQYPLWGLTIRSYTDANLSLGVITHKCAYHKFTGGQYESGASQRVDGQWLGNPLSQTAPTGLDGQFVTIFLEDPIESDHPYIKLEITGCARNISAFDASFDWGLWDNEIAPPNGPTLSTSNPKPSPLGGNNNHMELSATSNDIYTAIRPIRMREDHEYILKFSERKKKISGSYSEHLEPFEVHIFYYDRDYNTLGYGTLYKSDESRHELTWGEETLRINYNDGGTRYSGSSDLSTKALVPDGTMFFGFRFYLHYNTTGDSEWKIDDILIYRNSLPAGFKHHQRLLYDSSYCSIHNIQEPFGVVKIRRIGMFGYDFSLSRGKGYGAVVYDLGGQASANPQSINDGVLAGPINRGLRGNILGVYTPKSGNKRKRTMQIIGTTEQKEAILSRTLIGLIDTNGDWSEYVIIKSTLTCQSIPSLSGRDDEFDYIMSFRVEET